MTLYRDTYALIRLDYLKYNVEQLYNKINKPMIAIIKANAYGHGYKEVAMTLKNSPYISLFGVATLKEAVDLRKMGIKQDILVLGAIPLEDLKIAIDYDITLTVFSFAYIDEINASHHYDLPVKVHIKLDTGMNRIGFKSKDEFKTALEKIDPAIMNVEGVFTHFATADEPAKDADYHLQLQRFVEIVGNMKFKYIHCANSAAIMYHEDSISNLARIGIAMYGVDPTGDNPYHLKQVMSLYTKVAMIKKVKKGESVGYGLTYTASQDELIATLPIGYADGFIRANQGRQVYINGRYYEIVGRVCMDQLMIRADENVHEHDQVEIFGEHISLTQMANELHTIPYEITCLLSGRVERIYED